jgi:hypothetical protein
MRLTLAVFLVVAIGCEGQRDESDAFWNMPNCPTVDTGAYRSSIAFQSSACVPAGTVWSESVFIDETGLLEGTPGCAFTKSKKAPASCSAAVELTCPVRLYVGTVKVPSTNALVFDGTMKLGDGCTAPVKITYTGG